MWYCFRIKDKKKNNLVISLLGDGECQEGTIWESANIAANRNLTNIIAIIDWNGSAKQLMPIENLKKRWESFGWNAYVIDGHNQKDFFLMKKIIEKKNKFKPIVFLAKTTKGKGVSFLEGHGKWHHKLPNKTELKLIEQELKF